jgi:ATP-dependent DNA ligase
MRPANRSYDRRPKLCAMQMEGIVSKSVAAPNRSGRNEAWLKIKCVQRGEFPIVGFVKDPPASPNHSGADAPSPAFRGPP